MLEKAASFVLASLKASTYQPRTPRPFARCGRAGRPFWSSCGSCASLEMRRRMN